MDEEFKRYLLSWSRYILETKVGGEKKKFEFQNVFELPFSQKYAGFVTLRESTGSLRGCIGNTSAIYSLKDLISKMTVATATQDTRFTKVQAKEIFKLIIEISILDCPKPLATLDDLTIGRDGIIVEKENARGLLLPQVAVELNLNKMEFFKATLRKAGLSPLRETWNSVSTFYFSAIHFQEQKKFD